LHHPVPDGVIVLAFKESMNPAAPERDAPAADQDGLKNQ
jgi:hypothetical protein